MSVLTHSEDESRKLLRGDTSVLSEGAESNQMYSGRSRPGSERKVVRKGETTHRVYQTAFLQFPV